MGEGSHEPFKNLVNNILATEQPPGRAPVQVGDYPAIVGQAKAEAQYRTPEYAGLPYEMLATALVEEIHMSPRAVETFDNYVMVAHAIGMVVQAELVSARDAKSEQVRKKG
jgi:hypothetical protein